MVILLKHSTFLSTFFDRAAIRWILYERKKWDHHEGKWVDVKQAIDTETVDYLEQDFAQMQAMARQKKFKVTSPSKTLMPLTNDEAIHKTNQPSLYEPISRPILQPLAALTQSSQLPMILATLTDHFWPTLTIFMTYLNDPTS